MSFPFDGHWFNLIDTPGHEDFSEDTYRTLTAVDAAIMVIDGAKGVESQTRKLFEVCRLRDLPILTFCNKMDRESRDTFEIIDEIQETLALDVAPASWPIGMGRDFVGAYDLLARPARADEPGRAQREGPVDQPRGARRSRDREARPRAPARPAARGSGDGARASARLRPAELSRRPHDADLVRLGHQLLRRARADARHRRLRPAAAAAHGGCAPGLGRRAKGLGLRLQGPGEHGPQAPRPGCLRPPLLGPFRARHEAAPRPGEEADGRLEPGPVPRLRARDGRGRLGGRHHRHPEPRAAAHRRRADRGREPQVHRHPELCARASAGRAAPATR